MAFTKKMDKITFSMFYFMIQDSKGPNHSSTRNSSLINIKMDSKALDEGSEIMETRNWQLQQIYKVYHTFLLAYDSLIANACYTKNYVSTR